MQRTRSLLIMGIWWQCRVECYLSHFHIQGSRMTFSNPDTENIRQLLRKIHSIAIVGLSSNEARPSFSVARGLQGLGYRIIPVRPLHGGAKPPGAGVAASHLLPQREGGSEAAGNPLAYSSRVQSAGFAITSDWAVVSGQPSQMASSSTSNVPEVRPLIDEVLGEQAYPDLESLPELPDIVDVFRAAEHVPAIVESCIKLGIKNLWLQEGVFHEVAAQRAQQAGITVVMNRCMWRDCKQLCGERAVMNTHHE